MVPNELTRADCIVIGGPPGAGKTTAANLLARMMQPIPAVIDKDVMYDHFVGAMLRLSDQDPRDRESDWYALNIKSHEYNGLLATARAVRTNGCPVIVVGPFHSAARDPLQWQKVVNQLGGGPVTLVWVRCNGPSLQRRIVARAEPRDGGKQADWARFLGRSSGEPPTVADFVIDNNGDRSRLEQQLHSFIVGR